MHAPITGPCATGTVRHALSQCARPTGAHSQSNFEATCRSLTALSLPRVLGTAPCLQALGQLSQIGFQIGANFLHELLVHVAHQFLDLVS